jgi:hypothetical protein
MMSPTAAASTARAACAFTLFALALSGCALENRVRIVPGATRDSLVFAIGGATGTADTRVIYGLTVERCAGDLVFWTVVGNGTRTLPDRIRYGQALPGFATTAGPLPLSAGCYRVIVSQAPALTFDVGPDGVIRARER